MVRMNFIFIFISSSDLLRKKSVKQKIKKNFGLICFYNFKAIAVFGVLGLKREKLVFTLTLPSTDPLHHPPLPTMTSIQNINFWACKSNVNVSCRVVVIWANLMALNQNLFYFLLNAHGKQLHDVMSGWSLILSKLFLGGFTQYPYTVLSTHPFTSN